MSAQVHLTYDSSRGFASYSLTSDGTLTITAVAKDENFQVVQKIVMQCDAGQSRTATYGGTSSVTFTSTGHTACSSINVEVVFGDDTSGDYTVYVTPSVAQGLGNVSGGGSYKATVGSIVSTSLSAEPEPGYEFDHWRISNASGTIDRNVTSRDCTLNWTVSSSITSNIFYAEAYFKPVRYTIQVYAYPAEGGTVTGGGEYGQGDSAHLVATPSANYEFVNWSDGVTDPDRTLTVDKDLSLYANFRKKKVTIKVDFNPPGAAGFDGWLIRLFCVDSKFDCDFSESGETKIEVGLSYRLGIYQYSTDKYVFKCWEDGTSEAVRGYIVAEEDKRIVANFIRVGEGLVYDNNTNSLMATSAGLIYKQRYG